MSSGPDYTNLIPFFLVALLLAMLSILSAWRVFDRNVDRVLAAVLVVAACVVAGTSDLGTDAPAYHQYYDLLTTASQHYTWWEPGFEYMARVFARLGAPYGLFVAVCLCISYVIKLLIYDEFLPNLLFALFVLYCLNIGEVAFVREYLAASLILLMYYLLMKRQALRAILALVAAVAFHKSALIAGLVVILITYGYRSLYPTAIVAVAGYLVYLALPPDLLLALESRVLSQTATYAAQGFVQGLGSADTSLFRNIAKFGLYVLLALWMVAVPVSTYKDVTQRKAAYVVLALSVVSVALITISPVFARLSPYIFVFIPLSIRIERFRPALPQLGTQALAMFLLICYFAVAVVPLANYL